MSDHAAVYHTYNDHVLSSYKKGKKAPQKKYKSSSYDLTNIFQVFWWHWKCCVRNKQHLSQYSMLNQSKIFIMIFSVISSLRLNRKDSWHYFSPKCVQDLFFVSLDLHFGLFFTQSYITTSEHILCCRPCWDSDQQHNCECDIAFI